MIIDQADLQGKELVGQVAVVTGAGQGIGRETARVLAHLGAAVAVVEIKDSGQETEALIRAEGGDAPAFSKPMSPTQQAWSSCSTRSVPSLAMWTFW